MNLLQRFRIMRSGRRDWATLCARHAAEMRENGWSLVWDESLLPEDSCDCCAGLSPNDFK